jgi:hypothetical protein
MKNKVVIEVPVGSFGSTGLISLSPPCTCCGAPVLETADSTWHHFADYDLRYWGRGKKFGSAMLGPVVDAQGKQMKGHVEISAPFCAEHQLRHTIFDRVHKLGYVIGALVGGVATFLIYTNNRSYFEHGEILFVGLALFVVGIFLGILLARGINLLITLIKPKLAAYPMTDGHWGLEAHPVRIDSGQPMVGPIRYFLPLGFYNVESARRFLKGHAQAVVKKGQKYLDKLA